MTGGVATGRRAPGKTAPDANQAADRPPVPSALAADAAVQPHLRRTLPALAILLLAYVLNFVDRQVIGILAAPIKAELHLTDMQLGLMGGLAFALFYAGLGLPIAWLADRHSRVKIMALALTLFSAATAACGLAGGFAQLFLCRMLVGVGEAGGTAPAYSVIADTFSPAQRGRALSVFSFGVPLGSAIGILAGGWIAGAVGWRAAFLIVGAAGLLVVPLLRWGVAEPVRGGTDAAPPAAPPSVGQVAAVLRSNPSFWLLSFTAAACSIIGYGSLFWLPSVFRRSFGLSLMETSRFYGSIVLVGGLIGIASGGWLADRLGRTRPCAYALLPAVFLVLTAPVYAAALFSQTLTLAWLLFVLAQALGLAWIGPVVAAVQNVVPPSMRTTASACFQLVNNVVGLGFGVVVIGALSDRLGVGLGADGLRVAMLYGLGFYLVAAALSGLASLRLERDWVRAAQVVS